MLWLFEGACWLEVTGPFQMGFFRDLVASVVKAFGLWDLIFNCCRLDGLRLLQIFLNRFLGAWRLHLVCSGLLLLFGCSDGLLNWFLDDARILSALFQRRASVWRDTVLLYVLTDKLAWIFIILLIFTRLDDVFFNFVVNIRWFLLLLSLFGLRISSSRFSSFFDVVHYLMCSPIRLWAWSRLLLFWNHLFWGCS